MTTNPVATALSAIVFGPDVTFEHLTMIPLLRKHPEPANAGTRTVEPGNIGTTGTPWYIVLDDALESCTAEVTEIGEHGSVPELTFLNRGPDPVLIVDGEELVGAKQNRVVNLTILVGGRTNLTIPVSCVEAGRWRARSKSFTSAPRAQFAKGRAKRVAQVTQSLRDRGDRMSDQAEVWADIAAKSASLGAFSPTAAMSAIYADNSASIDGYVSACGPVDGQVGAVFIVDGAVVGFDLFDDERTLRKLLPKLVRSAAVEALDSAARSSGFRGRPKDDARGVGTPSPLARLLAEQFVAVASSAPQHVTKAVGLGDDVRLSGPGLAGAALVVDGRPIHVAAFAL